MITTWIRLAIILVVGIAMLIIGIYGKCKVGKKKKQLRKVLDSVEEGYNTILLCGLLFVLFGAFLCINHLMEEGLITDISNTFFWMLIRWVMVLTFGVVLIISGLLIRKKRVEESGLIDAQVTGTVVGVAPQTKNLPGYGRLIIEYKDPYDDSIKCYKLMQDLKLKSHPIGNSYNLAYSRTAKSAYDVETNKLYNKREIFVVLTGVFVCVVVMINIVLYVLA